MTGRIGAVGEVFGAALAARADVVRRPDRASSATSGASTSTRRGWLDEVAFARPRDAVPAPARARPAASSASRSGRGGPGWPAGVAAWLGFTLPSAIALACPRPGRGLDRPVGRWLGPRPEAGGGRGRRPGGLGHGRRADAGLAAAGRGARRGGGRARLDDPVLAGRDHRRRGGHRPAGCSLHRRPPSHGAEPSPVSRRVGLVAIALFAALLVALPLLRSRRRPAGRDGRGVLPIGRAGLRRRPRRPAAAPQRRSSIRAGCRDEPVPRRLRCGAGGPGAALHVRGLPRRGLRTEPERRCRARPSRRSRSSCRRSC